MLESIINTIFSIPYLLTGITLAAILDFISHRAKVTTRLTFLEIWGCIMFWPVIIFFVIIAYIITIEI